MSILVTSLTTRPQRVTYGIDDSAPSSPLVTESWPPGGLSDFGIWTLIQYKDVILPV